MDRRRLSLSRRPLGVRDRVGPLPSGDPTRRGLSADEREHLRFVLDSYRTLTRHWQSLSERLIEHRPDEGEVDRRHDRQRASVKE